jgi:hypothetical protein
VDLWIHADDPKKIIIKIKIKKHPNNLLFLLGTAPPIGLSPPIESAISIHLQITNLPVGVLDLQEARNHDETEPSHTTGANPLPRAVSCRFLNAPGSPAHLLKTRDENFSLLAKIIIIILSLCAPARSTFVARARSTMWRLGQSQSEPSQVTASNLGHAHSFITGECSPQMARRAPIESPYGHQLTRRVTWRSSTYKIIAYLYVLGILYIVWLIRDLFWLPFSSSPYSSHADPNGNQAFPKEYVIYIFFRFEIEAILDEAILIICHLCSNLS